MGFRILTMCLRHKVFARDLKNTDKNTAEVFLGDFSGFQAKGEWSLLNANDRALSEDAVAKQQIHTCKSAKST